MRDVNSIDFYDFYFNGRYVSDLGGIVADDSGGKIAYSLVPEREYVTNSPKDVDGEFVFMTRIRPRTWQIPVFFEDLAYTEIKNISSWLDSPKESEFYFRGDSLMIKARVAPESIDIVTYSGNKGLLTIPFIAHDPYYYDIYGGDTKYI